MKPIKPKLVVPGDREDKILWETGHIVGFCIYHWPIKHLYKVVWCFGFLPDSVQAKAYGISVDQQFWVISDGKGNVRKTFSGLKKDLPIWFWDVLDKEGVFFKTDEETSKET